MIYSKCRATALLAAVALIASVSVVPPVYAQQKSASKAGFTLKPGAVKIVLMRPAVHVGAQSTGGLDEPNAEWTNDARKYLAEALRENRGKLGNVIIDYDEGLSGEGPLASQYTNLFGAVSQSVTQYQFFAGNRLPTKKRKGSFEWSLGPGITKLQSLQGADYALFINTYDSYGTTGRKVLQLFSAMAGISVVSGVHRGGAGLIDLKTGDLVWYNTNLQIGGDIRKPDGAAQRVQNLLKGFPGAPVEAAVKK